MVIVQQWKVDDGVGQRRVVDVGGVMFVSATDKGRLAKAWWMPRNVDDHNKTNDISPYSKFYCNSAIACYTIMPSSNRQSEAPRSLGPS